MEHENKIFLISVSTSRLMIRVLNVIPLKKKLQKNHLPLKQNIKYSKKNKIGHYLLNRNYLFRIFVNIWNLEPFLIQMEEEEIKDVYPARLDLSNGLAGSTHTLS